MNCIFCSIVSKKSKAVNIFENDEFIAFMDKYPINMGHVLVLPKKHHQTILDMQLEDTGKLFSLSSHLAKAVVKAVNADGFTLGQNNGEAANQEVPHVHVHIVPRFNNDSEGSRWPSRKIVLEEELNNTATKIQKYVESISL
ncbi:MAG: HIT family protein [Thaumarchaeota archaeon]|nr:HIT family protein [Nitrososphaerota archaeon]